MSFLGIFFCCFLTVAKNISRHHGDTTVANILRFELLFSGKVPQGLLHFIDKQSLFLLPC